jgi:nitrite reductase/ring-hydroxylating ferredoxin subunit
MGAMQQDHTGFLPIVLFLSVALVGGMHLYTAVFCSGEDKNIADAAESQWVDVGSWRDIENDRAITVQVGNNERVAVFRFDEFRLSAVSNVCQHQNGPLGEGRVIDGCITCPWHGYQYRPEDGCSPPPFTEKIETYRLKLTGERVLLDPKPLPKGTPRPIVEIAGDSQA